jgi:hypothetical protein
MKPGQLQTGREIRVCNDIRNSAWRLKLSLERSFIKGPNKLISNDPFLHPKDPYVLTVQHTECTIFNQQTQHKKLTFIIQVSEIFIMLQFTLSFLP